MVFGITQLILSVLLVDSIVLLPRSQRDDINFSRENLNVEQTAKALIDDFGLAMETGALGWLSVHSQNFKPDDVLFKATPIFLDHVKKNKDSTWLATAGQVADWWRERDRFKISYKQLGQRLEFNVTVTGNKPVSGGSLTLMLPQKGVFATVRALKIGMKEPEVRKIDEYRSAIVFSTLEPGNYAYLVTFSLIN
jgi:hypothetical protein